MTYVNFFDPFKYWGNPYGCDTSITQFELVSAFEPPRCPLHINTTRDENRARSWICFDIWTVYLIRKHACWKSVIISSENMRIDFNRKSIICMHHFNTIITSPCICPAFSIVTVLISNLANSECSPRYDILSQNHKLFENTFKRNYLFIVT